MAKAVLRETQTTSEVKDFSAPADYEAVCVSPHFITNTFNVLSTYPMSADTRDPDVLVSGNNAMGYLQFGLPRFLSNRETTLVRSKPNCFIGLSASIFIHGRVLTILWHALLPATIVMKSGTLTSPSIVLIAYSRIVLTVLGSEFADPYGDDVKIPIVPSGHRLNQRCTGYVSK